MKEVSIEERKRRLRQLLAKGTVLYTLTHKATNTARYVRVFVVDDGDILNITGRLCAAGMFTWYDKLEAIRLLGSGYGAASTIAEEVSQALYRDPSALRGEYLQ